MRAHLQALGRSDAVGVAALEHRGVGIQVGQVIALGRAGFGDVGLQGIEQGLEGARLVAADGVGLGQQAVELAGGQRCVGAGRGAGSGRGGSGGCGCRGRAVGGRCRCRGGDGRCGVGMHRGRHRQQTESEAQADTRYHAARQRAGVWRSSAATVARDGRHAARWPAIP